MCDPALKLEDKEVDKGARDEENSVNVSKDSDDGRKLKKSCFLSRD